jgi:uncharacterized protein (DUF58 family)
MKMSGKTYCMTLFFLLLSGFFGLVSLAVAAESVMGRYLEKAGTRIGIELEVAAPAPPLVIVLQSLPAGVRVVEADPESKLADPGQGQVKWLLSGLTAGKHRLELKLDQPVAARAGGGEIRYRNPADGNMVRVEIAD